MKIDSLGDSALIINLADEITDSHALLARVLGAAKTIEEARLPGVVDVTCSYQTIAVFFNLTEIEADVEEQICALITSDRFRVGGNKRRIEIPVCYDKEFAFDLARVASHTSLIPDRIVALHSSAKYTVACIGFMPGFPFLAGLPKQLHVPRLETPRTKVPAGSVAIANAQAGVYPLESPGGWNVIGRTPLRLFQVDESPPTLLRPGDSVQFRRITRDEFQKLNEKRISITRRSSRATRSDPVQVSLKLSRRDPSSPPAMTLSVISAGFQTTVQDCGRIGLRKFGVTPGGALDPLSLRLANLLVGNSECAGALECGSGRFRLRFHDERLVAWAGGDFEMLVGKQSVPTLHCARASPNAELEISPQRAGRAWLAISGGINVPEVLGSRTTDLRAHFGGWEGRSLRDGDELPLGVESKWGPRMRNEIRDCVSPWSAPRFVRRGKFLRVVRGRNWHDQTGNKLLTQTFRVAMNSDRMGLRLDGQSIALASGRELVSEAVAPGTVQLPPSGTPVVLLQGCQTIGGYPKIAHVITVDLGQAAQLQPFDEVRFELIELEQARELLREREREIALFRAGLEARFG